MGFGSTPKNGRGKMRRIYQKNKLQKNKGKRSHFFFFLMQKYKRKT